jgi:hypothetical protein
MHWANHLRRLPATIRRQFAERSRTAQLPTPLTFCIAHFNAPDFLDVALAAVRKYHGEARIIVSDSLSAWRELQAAQLVCRRHGAELHTLASRRSHNGLLDYMFARVQSPIAVYLDQDCVLLGGLDPLLAEIQAGRTLIGPRDEMRLTHPQLRRTCPETAGIQLRRWPNFLHASLLVVDVRRIGQWSKHPFHWPGSGAEHYEPYYAIVDLVRARQPDGVLPLESAHTGYGLGQLYQYEGEPLAYHNWYSGQVYGRQGKLDGTFDADWLRSEAARFIADCRAGRLDLSCPGTAAEPRVGAA